MKKAIIAMSGGVDSSVAALLTKESGDECIGATMKLYNNEDIGVHREKTCCSLDDVEDARSVAYQMDMPYYVFNFTADFHTEVMDRFVDAYENGCTPNPCIDCNRYLKFDKMFHRMQEIGYDYIVTGHYARVEYDEKRDRYLLKKAVDRTRFVSSPKNMALSMPESMTVRISALYRTATMRNLLRSTQAKKHRKVIL